MTRRVLRALLRLAPDEFRSRYGRELLKVYDARVARLGPGPRRVVFAVREIAGVVILMVRLRMDAVGRGTKKGGGATMLETTGQDLRYAVRTLRRNPGFAFAATAVLALGIGANTAIFSAANAYFFRPLPFGDAERLVMLYETNPEFGWEYASAAPANVLDWREQVDAFEDVAIYTEFVSSVTFVSAGEPELLRVSAVTGNFFDVLDARPALGRTFRWDETWEGNDDVVVLSHRAWVAYFGADPGVVGRTVEFAAGSAEVVGIMPEGFSFPDDNVHLWTPWGWAPSNREQVWFRRAHWVRPVARLEADATLEEADAQLQVVVGRLASAYPETNRVMGAGLLPLRDFLIRDVRTPLLVLVGAVGVLLLLACTNVANLVLVRASDRGREVAMRFALGAARGRVARQMLTESLLLAGAGGAVGLGVGWMGVRAMEGLTSLGIHGATGIALDHRVILFTVAATAASGLLFGLGPLLRWATPDVSAALKDGGRGGSPGRRALRAVNALVVTEVALALLLVVGAGLLVRSFLLLRAVDPGFTTEATLGVRFTVPSARYAERDQVLAFYDQLLERLEGRPGIRRAGLVGQLPLGGRNWSSQFQAEGWPPDRVGFEIVHRRADRGYFEALGVPLVRGRLFGPDDGADAPLVVVVNETFVRQHFPGEDPLGQKIAYDRAAAARPDDHHWYEIVGVVGDQHQVSPGQPVEAEVFEHARQDWGRDSWVVLRTNVEPLSVVPAVRSTLKEMDPLIALGSVRPLREVWRASMAREELILTLLGIFAVVALLLASVGVYGVTAQAARKRTQEIGIRMALGARAGDVVGLVLRQGLRAVLVGLVVGLGIALVASRALATLLFGVEPNDPGTLVSVVGLLAGVAAVACYVPARRASAVDPVRSLRSE